MFSLQGKTALVTGSTKGIGRGVALGLARAGADVAINSHTTEDDPLATVKEIERLGRRAIFIQADVTSEADVGRMFESIASEFGRLDILVNNAGTNRMETIFETELDNWNHIIQTNLTSAFLCSKHAMSMMKKQQSGRIIQMSSVVAHQGALYGHVHYGASKSGLLGLTKTLARTGAQFGITVNSIAPGIIYTDLLVQSHGEQGIEKLRKQIPLGLGTVEDVAAAAVFLASDKARYITGSTIDVNGGFYIR